MDIYTKTVSKKLIEHACQLAVEVAADAILIYADVANSLEAVEGAKNCLSLRSILVMREGELAHDVGIADTQRVTPMTVPNLPMTRWEQVKVALLIALARGILRKDAKVVLMTGVERSTEIDTIMALDLALEFKSIVASDTQFLSTDIKPEVFERAISLAGQIAIEGREGRSTGAIFTLGDSDNVLAHSTSLILNPFSGYRPEQRNILDQRLEETLKEFSTIDGAFVIKGDGTIESAGTRLLAMETLPDFPKGLGTRHAAAAAITTVTEAISISVSQSTGTITIFKSGKLIAEISGRPHRTQYYASAEAMSNH